MEKQIDELKQTKVEAEQPKRWKPKDEEDYWYVGNGGAINSLYWCNDVYCNWLYLTGNCFKTLEEAEEYKKQIESTARYKNYIEEHSEPIEWGNSNSKYIACFDFGANEIDIGEYYISKNQGTIYASSKEIIWNAIKEIGEDNFKKYVLGVK